MLKIQLNISKGLWKLRILGKIMNSWKFSSCIACLSLVFVFTRSKSVYTPQRCVVDKKHHFWKKKLGFLENFFSGNL